ncbi:hypothetical protein ACFQVC_31245 [Streptomyces monticola]|uniref:Uncharacterized protein n=1 Tax=Streptomyces monticola TaxID=2666263 RepID=A0ABW2JTM9_9ACTN
MAHESYVGPTADPVLPFPSRLGLLLWFVLQWVLIPVEFVLKIVWVPFVVFGDGHADDLMRIFDAPARFLSPGKLMLRLSHDAAKREAALDREFARLAGEIGQQQFSWHTRIFHYLTLTPAADGGRRLKAVALHAREYRGIPVSVLQRTALRHGLVLEARKNLKDGVQLLPAHRQVL